MMNKILYTHNNLEDWKQRIISSTKLHFGNQVKYFVERLEQHSIYDSILKMATKRFPFTTQQIELMQMKLADKKVVNFDCEEQEAAFAYQFLNYLIEQVGYNKLNEVVIFQGKDFNDTQCRIIEQLISPQIALLNDKFSKDGLVLHLLEKYKLRCEWFTKDLLKAKYDTASASY
jgi:hypothetical protein